MGSGTNLNVKNSLVYRQKIAIPKARNSFGRFRRVTRIISIFGSRILLKNFFAEAIGDRFFEDRPLKCEGMVLAILTANINIRR